MEPSKSTESSADAPGERFEVTSNASNHFAWLRTRFALERTVMASVRTAVALVGFGFTIVQFFERFGQFEGVAPADRPLAPRYIGLALIGAGIALLAISAWQYREVVRYMWSKFRSIAGIDEAPHATPIYPIILGMILIAVFAFVAVLTRSI